MAMAVGGGKGGAKAEIDVTPLIDVLLVLLIIFMVITPLTHGVETWRCCRLVGISRRWMRTRTEMMVIMSVEQEHEAEVLSRLRFERLGPRLEEIFREPSPSAWCS